MSLFMIAIPLGSGMGFLAGGKMVELANYMGWAGGWQWSLRVTPPLAILCIILLLFVMPSNIPRGHSEGIINDEEMKGTYVEDLRYLFTNKSFLAITAGNEQMLIVRLFNCVVVKVLSASPSQWAHCRRGSRISWPLRLSTGATFPHVTLPIASTPPSPVCLAC